ncbi:MAG TPA: hypothetical protein VFF09_02330, partial [archaeon]|nr:hypothetical protein [archaeon]
MPENRQRLIDAARRLIEAGTSGEEALKSMAEIGVSAAEAKSIVEEATKKAASVKAGAPEEKDDFSMRGSADENPVPSEGSF